jgi:hypothetical protein
VKHVIRWPLVSAKDLSTKIYDAKVLNDSELTSLLLYHGSDGMNGNPKYTKKPRPQCFSFGGIVSMRVKPKSQMCWCFDKIPSGKITTWTILMHELKGTNWDDHIFGIARANHPKTTYLGAGVKSIDMEGWGYCANDERTHNNDGTAWSQSYQSGDRITFICNLKASRNTLQILKNGNDLGVAFDDLRHSDNNPLYFACSSKLEMACEFVEFRILK